MKREPYRAIVDDAGRALCGWVLSDGRHCLDRATHLGTETRWFLCRSHAEDARKYLKAELVELRKEEERELNAAKERIRRLEEAGDAMAKSCEVVEINQFGIEINGAWHKAKEAKP